MLAQVSITIDTHLHIELEVKHCSIVRTVWMFMDILWLVGLLFKQVLRTVADNFVKIFSIKSVLCLFYWRQVSSHQQHGHGSAQILINILSNATGDPQTLFLVNFQSQVLSFKVCLVLHSTASPFWPLSLHGFQTIWGPLRYENQPDHHHSCTFCGESCLYPNLCRIFLKLMCGRRSASAMHGSGVGKKI